MCRAAGVLPEKRATVQGREVFIADGFSAKPHETFKRFDIEQGDFPFGAFGTFWWIFDTDDKMSLGRPLFFDAFHDAGHTVESKQKMRIASAMKDAEQTLLIQRQVKH
jgi:hypothetical protein